MTTKPGEWTWRHCSVLWWGGWGCFSFEGQYNLFRPLELDPDLFSFAGAELGLDCPDFSSGEEYSGLTSSLGSEILMGLLEDLT